MASASNTKRSLRSHALEVFNYPLFIPLSFLSHLFTVGSPELLAEVSKSYKYEWIPEDIANYLTRKLYDGAQFAVAHSIDKATALRTALIWLCKDKPELSSKAGERGKLPNSSFIV